MRNKYVPWVILLLLFIATGLSFLDRQVLSMTIIKIQSEFNITDVQYGFVNTSFLISYALMFTIGGRLMDTVGSRLGLAFAVGIWSIANCLHGVMTGFYQLVAFRFLLGVGEGGCFPGSAKTVYLWFDEKRRAFANGIAIGGSAIGAVIAPPLTTYISGQYGWRLSFVIPGLIGVVWVIGWLAIPWGGRSEKKMKQRTDVLLKIPFLTLLKNREALIFILIRFLLDPVLYFIMFWAPKYLNAQRHIPFERIGSLFWIPFLAMGLSNIMGGWFSDQLVKKHISVNRARKIVMGIAALLTLCAPFIAFVSTVEMAVALMALVMFAHGFWITNYITSISDIFGANGTSTVVGLSGTAGAISGLIINPLIGWIVQNYSYNPIWIISGIMYPVAFLLLVIFVPKIRPLHFAAAG
jgi:ACS family hexuronate transporter-like MFS transporter